MAAERRRQSDVVLATAKPSAVDLPQRSRQALQPADTQLTYADMRGYILLDTSHNALDIPMTHGQTAVDGTV